MIGTTQERFIKRVWNKISEPKFTTIAWFVIYLVVFVTGVVAYFNPPQTITGAIGPLMVDVMTLAFAVGGLTGMLFTPTGVYIMERTSVVSVLFSLGLYLITLVSLQVLHEGPQSNRYFQAGIVIVTMLLFALRAKEVWSRPFNPARTHDDT